MKKIKLEQETGKYIIITNLEEYPIFKEDDNIYNNIDEYLNNIDNYNNSILGGFLTLFERYLQLDAFIKDKDDIINNIEKYDEESLIHQSDSYNIELTELGKKQRLRYLMIKMIFLKN